MSEIIPAVEAVAAPLLQEAEKALAPEAAIALQDLHSFVTDEMDKLRADLPTLVGQGVEHLQNLGAELLNRYHGVIAKVEAVMGVGAAAPAAAAPAPAAPVVETPAPAAAPVVPAAPVAVDPTVAPSTTEASSAPSSMPSTSATTTTPEAPAAPQA